MEQPSIGNARRCIGKVSQSSALGTTKFGMGDELRNSPALSAGAVGSGSALAKHFQVQQSNGTVW
jgi:hypothetical protein